MIQLQRLMDHSLKNCVLYVHVCDWPQVEQTLTLKKELGCLCGIIPVGLHIFHCLSNLMNYYFQNKVNPLEKRLTHRKIASSHLYFNINNLSSYAIL